VRQGRAVRTTQLVAVAASTAATINKRICFMVFLGTESLAV